MPLPFTFPPLDFRALCAGLPPAPLARLAPTPSGFLHWGNAYSFLLTFALARKAGGRLWLRVDDMDAVRSRPDFVDDIFESLRWLGIQWQRGPQDAQELARSHSQLLRLDDYREQAARLLEQGGAFGCRCSRKAIAQGSADGGYPGTCRALGLPWPAPDTSLRWRTPEGSRASPRELGQAGAASWPLPASARDIVLWRRDGLPAYHWVSVLDDLREGVRLVVRGQDLWDSTLAQWALSMSLGQSDFHKIVFLHHPLLLDAEGSKLSKSAGSISLKHGRESGLRPGELKDAFALAMGFESWEMLWSFCAST